MIFGIFLLGLSVGSFLNAYIFRLRYGGSVWRGRSHCPKCKKPLRWFELIPLVSFIIQLGRCRGCGQRIDIQYPLVELAMGILFVLGFDRTELSSVQGAAQSLALWYLLSVLVILFVYDLRYGLVPDRVVLPAIAVALIVHTLKLSSVQDAVQSLALISLAITIGAGFFWIQYVISKGRWLGSGDIRIGALMGAMLGWPHIIVGLVVSYMLGGLVGVVLLATGRKKFGQTVPLGTFLTIGTVITFLYGSTIWEWYWR